MTRPLTFLMIAAGAAFAWSLTATATAQEEREQYTVSTDEDVTVMVERRSGRTWLLAQPTDADRSPVWLPIERIDDPQEAKDWRQKQRAIAENLQHERQARREAVSQKQAEAFERARRQQLETLKNNRQELQKQLGDEHPSMKPLQVRIRQLEETLQRQQDEVRRTFERQREELEKAKKETSATSSDATSVQALEDQLRELLKEEQTLIQSFSKTHPSVKLLQKKIEGTRRFINKLQEQEAELHMTKELYPLILEKELLLETRGPEHPDVKRVRKEIEVTRNLLREVYGNVPDAETK